MDEQICVVCRATFTPRTKRGRARTCSPDCSAELNRQQSKDRKRRWQEAHPGEGRRTVPHKAGGQTEMVVIICDPLPLEEGGFSPGATMPARGFVETLRMGYITEGTTVRRGGKVLRVMGNLLIDHD